MFSLDRKLASSTCVAERSVGKTKPPNSVLPRPTHSRNSFHPFLCPPPLSPSPDHIAQSHFSDPPLPPMLPLHQSPSPPSRIIRPRKPHPDHSILYNELHPHVPASDRIFSWHTPFGSRHHAAVAQRLPPPLLESALMAIWGALAPNTKSTYGASPLRFTQFCDKWAIPEEDHMPADYALLCTFIGEFKGLQSGNTIRSWLSGLRSWHIINHAPWYGDDSWVHLARTSANKEGAKHKLAPRAPISIEHLSCLLRSLDLSTPFHAAIWAVALVTFFGCRHLGETTVSVGAAFDPNFHVLRSTKFVPLTSHALSLPFLTLFQTSFPCTA